MGDLLTLGFAAGAVASAVVGVGLLRHRPAWHGTGFVLCGAFTTVVGAGHRVWWLAGLGVLLALWGWAFLAVLATLTHRNRVTRG